MNGTAVKKATFKHIEAELYFYKDTIKEINNLREEIMSGKTNDDENVGGGRSSEIGKPTERIATRLMTNRRLQGLEEITKSIEKVYTNLPDTHQELVRVKYWTRPQTLTWDGIADKLHISKRQAMRWRDEVIFALAEVLGWR